MNTVAAIRTGYFEKVQAMMEAPAFPKDPEGGLGTTFPKTLAPLAGNGR